MPRRTFLQGMGASIALPVLDVMMPSIARAATPMPPRYASFYIPTGIYGHGYDPSRSGDARYFVAPPSDPNNPNRMTAWRPREVGPFRNPLPPETGILEPYKNLITIVSGLSVNPPLGNHGSSTPGYFCGVDVQPNKYPDLSADQAIANAFGLTPGSTIVFNPSYRDFGLEVGYGDMNTASYNYKLGGDPRCPKDTDPLKKFNSLFGSCSTSANAQRQAQQAQQQKSILDFVGDSLAKVKAKVSKDDGVRLDSFLQNIRDLESKLLGASASGYCPTYPVADPGTNTDGMPLITKVNAMVDILALSLASDAMPIATLMPSNDDFEDLSYAARIAYFHDFIGADGNPVTYPTPTTDWHFDVAHHNQDPRKIERLFAQTRYHMHYFLRLVQKMSAMPVEPNGYTPLDNSVLQIGAGLSDSSWHTTQELPICLAGGKKFGLNQGQHVAMNANTHLSHFYYTLLTKMGTPISSFNGSSTYLDGLFK